MTNAEKFSDIADIYAEGRPEYAADAVDYILRLTNTPDAVICDVGAGTGKLSRQISERGAMLYAVEPSAEMRGYLAENLRGFPNATALDGDAEHIPLGDGTADVIVCAQAFHWFDAARYRAECERVLRPNGVVAVVYNQVINDLGGNFVARERDISDFFGGRVTRASFPNPVSYTREGWLRYRLSHSHSARAGTPEYEPFIAEVNAQFDADAVDDVLTLRFVTMIYRQLAIND
ncbi:MAG: class I SAM-dependent methyltransferase [Oscillospiraceae bacterium]|jgi:SAM-dependent methyltransferase|nr:class I SAM-dependent methyltransferase [Oscillospiraceae bacterium]